VFEVQVRNEAGATIQYPSVKEAFDAAKADPTIWKVSWRVQETGEGVRFLRGSNPDLWMFEPLLGMNGMLDAMRGGRLGG
jgi:hypothetical protein